MLLFIVKLWLVANVSVFAVSAQTAQSKSCSIRDLKRWDCRLRMSGMVVHVTKDKILLSDGVWRAVDNIPMDKIIEWQQVRLEKLGKRLFLILSFWDEGTGETNIQSRHWIVSEVTSTDGNGQVGEQSSVQEGVAAGSGAGIKVKTEVKVKQIVQKRTLQNEVPVAAETPEGEGTGAGAVVPLTPEQQALETKKVAQNKKPEPKYLLDKAEKTELKSSHGKVIWRAGRETGVIE